MNNIRSILKDIPEDLLNEFKAYRISSEKLSQLTGFHAVAIRRAIKRTPREQQPKNKTVLIAARKAFRSTLSHLQPKEIKQIAHVSLSTANRIRKLSGSVNA